MLASSDISPANDRRRSTIVDDAHRNEVFDRRTIEAAAIAWMVSATGWFCGACRSPSSERVRSMSLSLPCTSLDCRLVASRGAEHRNVPLMSAPPRRTTKYRSLSDRTTPPPPPLSSEGNAVETDRQRRPEGQEKRGRGVVLRTHLYVLRLGNGQDGPHP